MRWAKVPEWLLEALVAVPQEERRSVAPGTALAGFVALSVRSNFRTGEARVDWLELADAIDVTPRAARRVVELLGDVGALRRDGDRWFLAVGRRDLQVILAGAGDPEVTTCDPQVRDRDLQVTAAEAIGAGQGADSTHPLRAESLSEQSEPDADVWGLLVDHPGPHGVDMPKGQMELALPDPDRPALPPWMREHDKVGAVRAMRSTGEAGARAQVPDAGGARTDDAGTDPGSVAEPAAGAVAR